MTISTLACGRRPSISGLAATLDLSLTTPGPQRALYTSRQQVRNLWFCFHRGSKSIDDHDDSEQRQIHRRHRSWRHKQAESLRRDSLWDREPFFHNQRRFREKRWASSFDKPGRAAKEASPKPKSQDSEKHQPKEESLHEVTNHLADAFNAQINAYRQKHDAWRRQLEIDPYDAIFGESNRMLKGYPRRAWSSIFEIENQPEPPKSSGQSNTAPQSEPFTTAKSSALPEQYEYDPISGRKIVKNTAPDAAPESVQPEHALPVDSFAKYRALFRGSESAPQESTEKEKSSNFVEPALDRMKMEKTSKKSPKEWSDADLEDIDSLKASDIRSSARYRPHDKTADKGRKSREWLERRYGSVHQSDKEPPVALDAVKAHREPAKTESQESSMPISEFVRNFTSSERDSRTDGIHTTLSEYEDACKDSRHSPHAPSAIRYHEHEVSNESVEQTFNPQDYEATQPSETDVYSSPEAYDKACHHARLSRFSPEVIGAGEARKQTNYESVVNDDLWSSQEAYDTACKSRSTHRPTQVTNKVHQDDTALFSASTPEGLNNDLYSSEEAYEEAALHARESPYAPRISSSQQALESENDTVNNHVQHASPEEYEEAAQDARESPYAPRTIRGQPTVEHEADIIAEPLSNDAEQGYEGSAHEARESLHAPRLIRGCPANEGDLETVAEASNSATEQGYDGHADEARESAYAPRSVRGQPSYKPDAEVATLPMGGIEEQGYGGSIAEARESSHAPSMVREHSISKENFETIVEPRDNATEQQDYGRPVYEARESSYAPKTVRGKPVRESEEVDTDVIGELLSGPEAYEGAVQDARKSQHSPKAVRGKPMSQEVEAVPEPLGLANENNPFVLSDPYDADPQAARTSLYAPKGLPEQNKDRSLPKQPELKECKGSAKGLASTEGPSPRGYTLVTYEREPGARLKEVTQLHQNLPESWPLLTFGSLLETLGSEAHSLNLDCEGHTIIASGGKSILYKKLADAPVNAEYVIVCRDRGDGFLYEIKYQSQAPELIDIWNGARARTVPAVFQLERTHVRNLTRKGFALIDAKRLKTGMDLIAFARPGPTDKGDTKRYRIVRTDSVSGEVIGRREILIFNPAVYPDMDDPEDLFDAMVSADTTRHLGIIKSMDNAGYHFVTTFIADGTDQIQASWKTGAYDEPGKTYRYVDLLFVEKEGAKPAGAAAKRSGRKSNTIRADAARPEDVFKSRDEFMRPIEASAQPSKEMKATRSTAASAHVNATSATTPGRFNAPSAAVSEHVNAPSTPYPPILVRRQENIFTGEHSHTGRKRHNPAQPSKMAIFRRRLVRGLLLLQTVLKTTLYGLVLVYVMGHVWANWREVEVEKGRKSMRDGDERSEQDTKRFGAHARGE